MSSAVLTTRMDGYDDSAPNFDYLFRAAENRSYSSVQYSTTVNKSVGIILTLILITVTPN